MLPHPLSFRDVSIASLGAAAAVADGPNGARQLLLINNTGNASVGVNFSGPATGGTGPGGVGNDATIGSAGTITLAAGSAPLILDGVVPSNPIVVKGTAGQPVTILVA